jgi:hypothetical protein
VAYKVLPSPINVSFPLMVFLFGGSLGLIADFGFSFGFIGGSKPGLCPKTRDPFADREPR